jgi:GT2 family glycosyltransferase
MDISIVIPNYNGEHLLRRNIPKVLDAVKDYASKNNLVEIIIVDDASVDNSVVFLKSYTKELQKNKTKRYIHLVYVVNKKNKGFSSTVNRGVRLATGTIVVLLNTDVVPEKNFLEKVVPHFVEKKLFAVGFLDKSIEDGTIVLRGRGIGTWKRGLLAHRAGDLDATETLWANGGSSAFRKSTWDMLGGMCELYDPFYWEDIDLSYRARKSGYTIHFDKTITVIHEHEKGAIRTNYTPATYKKIAFRNTLYFTWINLTDYSLLLLHIAWLPYHFLKTNQADNFAFTKGFIQAVKKIPSVIQARKKYTKHFVLSDKRVVKNFEK